ncbi:MAG: hypothetical protein KDK36_04910 [Leptospiraceae bacterium]|nr:hypothetical protein [Leptospiraceae bacterium]
MKKLLIFLIISTFFTFCTSEKKDDTTVRNLFLLDYINKYNASQIKDWNSAEISLTSSDRITSIKVLQSKFWLTSRGSFSSTGQIFYSSDGKTWTKTSYSGEQIYDINYINNQYIAVGGNSTATGVVYSSTDGATWTKKATISGSSGLTKIAGNTSFYVVSGSGYTNPNYFALATSTDLVNWTTGTNTTTSFTSDLVVTSSGVGYIGADSSGRIATCSTNCSSIGNWSLSILGSDIGIVKFADMNGTVIAAGSNNLSGSTSSGAYVSKSGGAFSKVSGLTLPAYTSFTKVIDSKFLLAKYDSSDSSNTKTFYYSSDGSTWKETTITTTASDSLSLNHFAVLNGTYVTDSSNYKVLYSSSSKITFP